MFAIRLLEPVTYLGVYSVQVGSLTQHYQAQEAQLQHGTKELQMANAISAEETSKCKAAKEVIRCLTMQVGSCQTGGGGEAGCVYLTQVLCLI